MNIILVSSGQYPDSHAAAIRHSTLAKGLIEIGHVVSFLLLTPQNWNGHTELNYFGTQFKTLNNYHGSNKVLKNYHQLKAIFKAKRILNEFASKEKIDGIVILTIDILPIYFLIKASRALDIKVFHERTELPYALGKQTIKDKALLRFYLNNLLPKFDGIFLISDKLISYIKQFNKATKKLLTVVDLSFFTTSKPSLYPFPYIGYCGTISGCKDGVPILIEAFAKITDQFPLVKLVLVGNDSDKIAINDTLDSIAKFRLEKKVIFSGLIERDMMPLVLCNAQILVVAKPDNEQNSGNFPIKIGEYLATGVPIVVTSVGEIPLFIQDGENGFLAVPGSPESFAQKMRTALENPVKSNEIGQRGKLVAEKLFDYRLQSAIMANYIKEVNEN